MTISANVRKELFEMTSAEGKLIRIKPTEAKAGTTVYSSKQSQPLKMWTQEEHEKFLEAMEKYPSGPWKVIAAYIGTKTTRQTMTHAQKYRQKISRWRRGLRHKGRRQANDQSDEASASSPTSYAQAACSARENLFKAIEYVSNDETNEYSSVPGTNANYHYHEDRNHLFKLAEVASIEVMKNEMQHARESKKAEGGTSSEPYYSHDLENKHSHQNVHWSGSSDSSRPPTKLWPKTDPSSLVNDDGYRHMQNGDDSNVPRGTDDTSRSSSGGGDGSKSSTDCQKLLTATSSHNGIACERSREENNQSENYRLPPLKMTSSRGCFAIPPLRSKVDPSVLVRGPQTMTQ